ncbi:MAG TPA: low molecular weight protein arginine phosphatase [Methylomirabilota bacterium]
MTGVLLVCHANTCRSVMAHVLLERMLADRGLGDVRVRSAGVARFARDGMLASLDARLVLREVGIHLAEDAMTSTDLKRHLDLLEEAAVVVTMTADQKQVVAELGAGPRPVLTLRELAGEHGDIGDPVGQGEEVYRACRDEIARCLDKGLERLLALRNGA